MASVKRTTNTVTTTYPYQSGWCGTNNHPRCVGVYAGTLCSCTCHKPKPPPSKKQKRAMKAAAKKGAA